MPNLRKKNLQPLVEVAVESEPLIDKLIKSETEDLVQSTTENNDSKLTVKEKKEIIKTCAEAVGIEISPAETKEFLRTIAKNSQSTRNEFFQAAKAILAAYRQRLNEESQQMMLEIRDEFVETIAESDKNFVEGVQQTFRDIQEFSTKSSRKSQENLATLHKSLEDGSLFDF